MWSSHFFASHDDIIDVRRNISVQLGVKYSCNSSVECASCIAKPLRHSYITVRAEGSCEAGLLFVRFVHENLVVAGEAIQHA